MTRFLGRKYRGNFTKISSTFDDLESKFWIRPEKIVKFAMPLEALPCIDFGRQNPEINKVFFYLETKWPLSRILSTFLA